MGNIIYLGTLTTSNLCTIFSATIALHCNKRQIKVLKITNPWNQIAVT